MKKTELINTKVYVDGRSAEIQEKLFKLGFSWFEDNTKVQHTDAPFLFMGKDNIGNLVITYLNNMEDFEKSTHRKIKVEDILNIEVPKFEPFQKVLVRDDCNEEWRANLFSYYTDDPNYPYQAIRSKYRHMIPYEGNEHLINTTDDPDIAR